MVFDKDSGKFLCFIGYIGNDLGGYSEVIFWIDDIIGELYFIGWNGIFMWYDL